MRLIQSSRFVAQKELTRATSLSRCVTGHEAAQIVHPGMPGFGQDSTRCSQGLLLALAVTWSVHFGNSCRRDELWPCTQ